MLLYRFRELKEAGVESRKKHGQLGTEGSISGG